jgi:hypothetical protein
VYVQVSLEEKRQRRHVALLAKCWDWSHTLDKLSFQSQLITMSMFVNGRILLLAALVLVIEVTATVNNFTTLQGSYNTSNGVYTGSYSQIPKVAAMASSMTLNRVDSVVYLFGGENGLNEAQTGNNAWWSNNLVSYEVLTNSFTRLAGADYFNPGIQTVPQGVPGQVSPPARYKAMLWSSTKSRLYLFAGRITDQGSNLEHINDL